MRALAGLIVVVSLLLAACGSDASAPGGDSGDVEAFCALMEESEESGDDLDPTTPEGQAQLAEILDTAPSGIKGDLEVLFEMVEQFEGVDENDPEAFEEAFALMFNPEFLAAAENLDTFAVEECGLPPSGDFGQDESYGDDLFGDDPFGDDTDGGDDSEESLETGAIRDFLETTHSETDWADSIVTIGVLNDSIISLGGPFDTGQAVAACEAAGGYAAGQGVSATVEVYDNDGALLAAGPDDAGICEAA